MKKKRGLSFDDKRERMLSIFSMNESFFHIKEVEKEGKKKGIAFPFIKDVLKSLIGDDLVESDKIGISIIYWSLKKKTFSLKKNKIQGNKEEISRYERENEQLKEMIKEVKKQKQETEEYKRLRVELESLQEEIQIIDQELEQYSLNDPEKYKEYENDNIIYMSAFEVLCDNILICNKILQEKGLKMTDVMKEEDFCGLFEEENQNKDDKDYDDYSKDYENDEVCVNEENINDEDDNKKYIEDEE